VQINRTDANDHREGGSKLRGDLVDGKDFEPVAGLDIVEVLHSDAALVPGLHLFHIVLEAPERGQSPLVHDDTVPHHPHTRAGPDDRWIIWRTLTRVRQLRPIIASAI